MIIKKLKVKNFKSIYGEQEFDFGDFTGVTKLTGRVGAGKTTLCEAILYALYGSVKGRKIPSLVSWNEKDMEAEIELVSNNKVLHITRGTARQTELVVDGSTVPAPSKRDMQDVINTYYDVPRIFVERMCVISFDASKMSLINMTPVEAKQFMDDVLGLALFTKYADVSNRNMLDAKKEMDTVSTAASVTIRNIENTRAMMQKRTRVLSDKFDTNQAENRIAELEKEIIAYSNKINEIEINAAADANSFKSQIDDMQLQLTSVYNKRKEIEIHGKAARKRYEALKAGVCPVCGGVIDDTHVIEAEAVLKKSADDWRDADDGYKTISRDIEQLKKEAETADKIWRLEKSGATDAVNKLRTEMSALQYKIKSHDALIKEMSANYDDMLTSQTEELNRLRAVMREKEAEQNEWTELTDIISSTLRYGLLGKIIPYINSSIQNYLSNMGVPFYMAYDESFKPHLHSHFYNKEIQYASLSTGQKKAVDMAAIFGVLDTVVSMYDFNVIVLDELFSNMDANMRNSIIQIMRGTIARNRAVFIVSHSDIDDSYFDHKLRAELHTATSNSDKAGVCIMKSVYNKVF